MYFRAYDGLDHNLWATDGTASGTAVVDPGCHTPQSFCPAGGAMYFNATDGANGRELWVTDGTSTGTHMVADIRAGGDSDPQSLTVTAAMSTSRPTTA